MLQRFNILQAAIHITFGRWGRLESEIFEITAETFQ